MTNEDYTRRFFFAVVICGFVLGVTALINHFYW